MKKIIISLIVSLLIVPIAYSASIVSDYANVLSQNYVKDIAPATITADSAGEITAEHGINLLIDTDQYILWNAVDSLTATGTAVDAGRIDSEITPEYIESYKVLHIPVNSDFEAGESFVLNGMQLRSYDREFSNRFIGLDINGDFVADASDINGYKVDASTHTDQTPPYPVSDVAYELNEDNTALTITWVMPPDYDLVSLTMLRSLTRDGVTSEQVLLEGAYQEQYTDEDVQVGDSIVYTIYYLDRRNDGEMYELTVNVGEPAEEPVEEPAEEPIEEPVEEPAEETELEELDRLFNYYKIRYQIKCLPSGVPALQNDSACLWARIDMVYAQEMLDRSEIDTAITDYDKELLAKRVQYPEGRYQDNCVDADEPASYCSALGKALERIHYFID